MVPPNDAAAMATAIERVARDEDLRRRLSAGAIERSAMFDVTAASRQIESIYYDVTGWNERG